MKNITEAKFGKIHSEIWLKSITGPVSYLFQWHEYLPVYLRYSSLFNFRVFQLNFPSMIRISGTLNRTSRGQKKYRNSTKYFKFSDITFCRNISYIYIEMQSNKLRPTLSEDLRKLTNLYSQLKLIGTSEVGEEEISNSKEKSEKSGKGAHLKITT